jgi:elongation factor Tu
MVSFLRQFHVLARVYFLRTDEGGRERFVVSGFRGLIVYDGEAWDADYWFGERDMVQPGETVEAAVRFMSPEQHRGRVRVDTRFEIREGRQVVARGQVLELVDPPPVRR